MVSKKSKPAQDIEFRTERRKIVDLIPHERNEARAMSPEEGQQLMDSIGKFNLAEIPAINSNNKILAGHQRIFALKALGRGAETIDVRVPNRLLTPAEEEEYLLRSNRNHGHWNQVGLTKFDEELLVKVGFNPTEIDDLKGVKGGHKDPDAIPEVKGACKARVGDLYRLGQHAHRLRAPEQAGILHGTGSALHRRHHTALGRVHRPEGREDKLKENSDGLQGLFD